MPKITATTTKTCLADDLLDGVIGNIDQQIQFAANGNEETL